MVNLDEQTASKELIKLQQQTEKAFDTDFMKQLAQNSRVMAETMEKAGLRSQFEQIQKQIVALAPLFQSLNENQKEKIIEVSEAISEPDTDPETLKENVLKAKDIYQECLQKWYAQDGCDYDFLWEVADDYHCSWEDGAYDTCDLAFQNAVNNATVKGQSIGLATMELSIQRLHQELSKKKKRNPVGLKRYNPDSEK